ATWAPGHARECSQRPKTTVSAPLVCRATTRDRSRSGRRSSCGKGRSDMDYRDAGVDHDGAEAHVDRIAPRVTGTWHPDVIGNFGGFAAGVRLPDDYRSPVLMMCTDGVGTKLDLARRSGRWEG